MIYNEAVTRPFFENLLPEETIREFISTALKVSSGNVFGLLERFGGDTAGAYSILPPDIAPSDEPRYLAVDHAIIDRYDRKAGSDGRISRLHQIDLCQAMNIPSTKKYEHEGGPTFVQCINYVKANSAVPVADGRRLIEWVAFNLIIDNMDSHAKNLSMLYEDGTRPRLAPFYDLINTRVYPNLEGRFAFKIGGENRPDWIMSRHWDRFCKDVNLSSRYVRNVVRNTVERVLKALPAVYATILSEVENETDRKVLEKIHQAVERNGNVLMNRVAPTVPDNAIAPNDGVPEP